MCIMSIEHYEHLVTTGSTLGKGSWGKEPEKMLDGLTKWIKVGQVTKE